MAVPYSTYKFQGHLQVKLHLTQDSQHLQTQLWDPSPSPLALGLPFWAPSLTNYSEVKHLGYKFLFFHLDGMVDVTLANVLENELHPTNRTCEVYDGKHVSKYI